MIDVYNNAGTESYGCFKHLKAAKIGRAHV